MTVAQLLTGIPQPLSNSEYMEWAAYTVVHNNKQEKAMKKAQASARSNGRRR